ncbi:MAG: class I SAM-dependent methyltransferase [Candidatus Azotimanducaceae bacterium]
MTNRDYNYQKPRLDLKEDEKYTADQARAFWSSPSKVDSLDVGENNPADYLTFNDGRTEMLFDKVVELLPDRRSSILELGPNAGRNLGFLYEQGYHNLHGIEINQEAVNLMSKKYPEVANNVQVDSIERAIAGLQDNEFDLVFSMAVLEHVSTESDFIFSEIARTAKRYIISIEDEVTSWSERHFPRNYKEVFEKGAWIETFAENCETFQCLDDRFIFRVFECGD